jgi:FG-GAP repeat protein
LAVADVNGDGRDDIIQGDHFDERAALLGLPPSGGEIRIWRGRPNGPARKPVTLTQKTPDIPGTDNSGDGFGFTVDAADVDADGKADIIAGVPADDGDEGSVAVIRGGRDGYAHGLNTRFYMGHGLPGERRPGDRLGWAVSALDFTGDGRIDVATSVPGAARLADGVFVLERTKGGFAPGETRVVRPLRNLPPVSAPDVRSIRLGRADDR